MNEQTVQNAKIRKIINISDIYLQHRGLSIYYFNDIMVLSIRGIIHIIGVIDISETLLKLQLITQEQFNNIIEIINSEPLEPIV